MAWRQTVFDAAQSAWLDKPLENQPLKFTMVYLTDEAIPGDINNFVKPVQDALNKLVYDDDDLIRDASAHLRVLSEPIDLPGLPDILGRAVLDATPCVYVAISASADLAKEMQ